MFKRLVWSHLAILMTSCSLASVAVAQESEPSGVENVVVSASRITTGGFSAPTPVTVLGAADIDANAQPSITNALVQLPALAGSRTTQVGNSGVSAGGNGIQSLGLRNLGNNRTLVLLNGQRIVPAATDGTVDVGQLPQGLIQRVDIVTGGASASWGSDAVAGVVNFVLDKKFEGFKGNFSAGISDYGDDANLLAELTGGTSFAGGRGHIEGTVTYNTTDGVPRAIGSRTWYNASHIVQKTIAQTPAGTPQYSFANNVSVFQFTPGGIITAGPLKGITFGNQGAVSNFNYGSPIIGSYMYGGQTNQIGSLHSGLDPAEKRGSFYGRVSYDVSPSTSFYADFMYGMEHNRTLAVADQYQAANLTLQCSNPFLPSSVASSCAANKVTSFQYGTNVQDVDIQSPVGGDNAVVTRTLHRLTAGGNGVFNLFGSDWSWDLYGEHGWNDVSDHLTDMLIIPLFKEAINVNTAANGSPQCANAVARAQGCLPLNIFGYNVADPHALSWVEGNRNIGPFLNTQQREEMVSLAFNGEPLKNWAGNVSTAFGFEYREEAVAQQDDGIGSSNIGNPLLPTVGTNNPLLSPTGNNWQTGNFRAAPASSYHVLEAFGEVVVPLLKSSSFGDADLNVAGRATQYTGAGYVNTWKVGLTYEPSFVDGLKLRALQSRDVRAPNLQELAPVGTTGYGFIIDDFPPYAGQSFNVYGLTAGNPKLKPEKGQTTQIGLVYSPSWFPGFNSSIDYYRIALKGGIGQLSTQQVVDTCFQGVQDACALITRDAKGQPTAVITTKLNLASVVTDGFDIETSYQADLADFIPDVPGHVTLRALGTNTTKYISNTGLANVLPVESAGDNTGNLAHWKGFLSESYATDAWSLTLFQRLISEGTLPRNWVQCTTACPLPTVNNPTIDRTRVAGAFYLDVGGTYNMTSYSQFYFKVENLTNLDPPMAPSNSFFRNGSNPGLYDTIGRFYRIGIRING
jgi:outer membrane receptor protein involved in Fe transport